MPPPHTYLCPRHLPPLTNTNRQALQEQEAASGGDSAAPAAAGVGVGGREQLSQAEIQRLAKLVEQKKITKEQLMEVGGVGWCVGACVLGWLRGGILSVWAVVNTTTACVLLLHAL